MSNFFFFQNVLSSEFQLASNTKTSPSQCYHKATINTHLLLTAKCQKFKSTETHPDLIRTITQALCISHSQLSVNAPNTEIVFKPNTGCKSSSTPSLVEGSSWQREAFLLSRAGSRFSSHRQHLMQRKRDVHSLRLHREPRGTCVQLEPGRGSWNCRSSSPGAGPSLLMVGSPSPIGPIGLYRQKVFISMHVW